MKPPPSLSAHAPASDQIAQAIDGFFRGGRIGRVFVAGGKSAPPPLAYLVRFTRLSVTLKGRDPMLVEQEGQPKTIRPGRGDAVLIPSNCWNRPDWTEASSVLNLLFGRNQVGLSLVQHDGRGLDSPQVAKTTVHGSLDGPVADMLSALLGLPADTEEAARLLVEALLKTCLQMMRQPASAPQGKSAGFYESLCMYIQEHFHLPLSRSSVAGHFRVSPNHISRVFKKNGRVTFNNYINYARVDRAKYLLKLHNQTVDEIAFACGYTDTAYFCRVFKAKTKLTPSVYRQRVRTA